MTVPTNNFLFIGTVPMNNFLFVGTVPMNNFLFVGTVPTNNFFLFKKACIYMNTFLDTSEYPQ